MPRKPNHSPARVLVVDDDPDLAAAVCDLLELRGYQVSSASHGQEALGMLSERPADVILLDMMMPVMNGWEFMKIYRERDANPAPVIVFTAARDAEERARDVGAEAWLGKPFELTQLMETLSRVLARKNG